MLVPPHSKLILREAVQNDSDFLAKSNIMDYSLVWSSLVIVSILSSFIGCSLESMKSVNKSPVVWWIPLVRENFPFFLVLLAQLLCIGSYTFAKTLEYKAKQGLKGGNDVTVIPPAEYQERFIKALDGYFMACPGRCLEFPEAPTHY